ncbi:MAG TPA: PHP domain-containing protein [Actinobacteria bacterium]|nr:PHP domain-containing protein [Actinomycetes bacterium]HEX21035.1 PHP domain-containing protein [Actinomycetota bacterium]
MAVDLHLHTIASDGSLNPIELIKLASALNLTTISVTDHDSVQSVDESMAAGNKRGIAVIPGIEMSSDVAGMDIHILGYFIDYKDVEFKKILSRLRKTRYDRAQKIVEKLREMKIDISLDDILEEAGAGALGRAHIAKVMLKKGYVEDMQSAFDKYLGRHSPAYVEKTAYSVAEIIKIIHQAEGIAVLAHPGISHVDKLIPEFVEAGLQGLEVYHSEHSAQQTERYLRLAKELKLITTGGSDCHGPGSSRGLLIGTVMVPDSTAAALFKLKRR